MSIYYLADLQEPPGNVILVVCVVNCASIAKAHQLTFDIVPFWSKATIPDDYEFTIRIKK